MLKGEYNEINSERDEYNKIRNLRTSFEADMTEIKTKSKNDGLTEIEVAKINQNKDCKAFSRQLLIILGVWTSFFMYGLCMGAPTVFIPQLRRDKILNHTITEEMASWLSSAHSYSAVPGVIILSILARYLGRKKTFLIVSITSLGGFLLLYFSVSVVQILISEIIQGLLFASQITIANFITTEYTSPANRGVFMSLKVASFFWGIWIANAVGTFLHWRKIALLGILCGMFKTVTILFSPESPYWLASKGRFHECAHSHRWLKGCRHDSEEELKAMIATQKDILKSTRLKDDTNSTLSEFVKAICSKEFYKPLLLSMLLFGLYNLSGKIVCSVYIIDIIKGITANERTAYIGMLILDGITVLSMYLGSGLTKMFKRRTILLTASSIAIVLLFIISTYLYVISLGLVTENKYFSIFLLCLYSVSISFGPINMCTTVYGELVSLRYRFSSMMAIGMFGYMLMATLVKLSPLIFKTFKLYGTFLFYGVSSLVLVLLINRYLPETKDKTLQEIQDSFNKATKREEIIELI